jgi:signal transduction histidine kinase
VVGEKRTKWKAGDAQCTFSGFGAVCLEPPGTCRGKGGLESLATDPRSRLELAVADSGSGITPEDMEKIFEPLCSTKAIGVGFGPPMVKQIVEQHGGIVNIESESGQGTRVTLSFPLQEVERKTA